jgi:hypothetical protein
VLCEAVQIPGHSPYPRENQIGTVCLDILWCASFASCAFWVWRMKGFRWFAISLMALLELPILGAILVAGMSVSGDWL